MIYLIGGGPKCGKTILAKKIALKKKISWISTDSLWTVVFNTTPKTQIKKKFSFIAAKTPKNKYHFETYSPSAHLQMEISEAESIWSGVKGLIEHLVNCRQNYIIEGVHLLPKLVKQFKKTRFWPQLKVVYLIKTDVARIKEGIPKNTKEFDWILEGGLNVPGRLAKAALMIRHESQYMAKEAKKYHFRVVNTEKDFIKTINKNLL